MTVIVVVPGANAAWRPDEPEAAQVASARLLVVQREMPDEVVARTLSIARSASVPVLMNGAPCRPETRRRRHASWPNGVRATSS